MTGAAGSGRPHRDLLHPEAGLRETPAEALVVGRRPHAQQSAGTQGAARGPESEYAFMAAVTGALAMDDVALARRLLQEGTQKWLRPGVRRAELAYLFNLLFGWGPGGGSPFGLLLLLVLVGGLVWVVRSSRRRRERWYRTA